MLCQIDFVNFGGRVKENNITMEIISGFYLGIGIFLGFVFISFFLYKVFILILQIKVLIGSRKLLNSGVLFEEQIQSLAVAQKFEEANMLKSYKDGYKRKDSYLIKQFHKLYYVSADTGVFLVSRGSLRDFNKGIRFGFEIKTRYYIQPKKK